MPSTDSSAFAEGPPWDRSGDEAGVHLPAPLSSFLGRTREIAEVAESLDVTRLVTLTGPPGIGKTRLALQVAGGYGEVARLVELASIADSALVAQAVATVLSVQEVPGQSLSDALLAHLSKRHLLLVLDNCEHLVGACAWLVDALVSGCPRLRVLATSREPLSIAGERVWQVPPLSLPDPGEAPAPDALMGAEAVRLFVERASNVQPSFVLGPDVAPAVAEICRRLDGIPLAIELAAARLEMLTPAEIARRLDDRFSLLTRASPSALSRHRTLQAALDWSHELLPPAERVLLRRLSVFVGGFDFEAAEAVCAGGQVEPCEVFDLLARLVSKSLVAADTSSSPRGRYRLLETIRAYGLDRLEEAEEEIALGEAHARHYLGLAERAEPELTGPSQEGWFQRLEGERGNLRTALDWSLGHGQTEWALRLAGALVLFWRVRCHFSEGRDLLDSALSAGEVATPSLRARALWGSGFLTAMAGDPDGAIPPLEKSLARFRELDDRQGSARALLVLGNCRQGYNDPSVLSLLEESAALAREAGDTWCLAHALGVAGLEYLSHTELLAARPVLDECLAVARQAGDTQGLRYGLIGLGAVVLAQGDYRSAESLLNEAVSLSRELGDHYSRATALQYLGELAIGRGRYAHAREVLDSALALITETGPPGAALEILLLLGRVHHAQGDRSGARRRFEECHALAGPASSTELAQWMGELSLDEGDLGEGRRLFEIALERARASGDGGGKTAQALHGLGGITRAAGDVKRAAALHAEALQLQGQIGEAPAIVASLEALGGLAAAANRWVHAARLLGAPDGLRERSGYARAPWERSRYEADVSLLREALPPEELEAAWENGAGLSIEDAVAEASKTRGPRGRPASGWHSLTETELRVVGLVAESLTNPEIAERLFITTGTVKTHLSHIFSKLGMAGRRELAREFRCRPEQPPTRDSESPRAGPKKA